MITALTITDEQIRELMSTRAAVGDDSTVTMCLTALLDRDQISTGYDRAQRMRARARCAEILNARAKDGGK